MNRKKRGAEATFLRDRSRLGAKGDNAGPCEWPNINLSKARAFLSRRLRIGSSLG